MALEPKTLVTYSDADIFAKYPQVSMNDHITAIFGSSAGAETLKRCAPVGFNSTTGFYTAWMKPDPVVATVDVKDSSEGDFKLVIDGVDTANFAYNATAEVVRTTLLGMGYSVTVTLESGVYTVTFGAEPQIVAVPVVTANVTGLGGGTGEEASVEDGTSSHGTHNVVGFVWPDPVKLHASKEVHGEVMIGGRIAYEYIAEVVPEADRATLAAHLKTNALSRGIVVEGLPNIH